MSNWDSWAASHRFDSAAWAQVRGDEALEATWPIEIYPDGDYYVWLAEDFRYGTFGHPWEPSLCVFGEELVAAVAEIGDEALGRVLRRNGLPIQAPDADPGPADT